MAEGLRRRLRPFPGVRLEFGGSGICTATRERIAVAKGPRGEAVLAPIFRSPGLGELARILGAAALRHADLSREIAEHEAVLADVRSQLRRAQMFMMRLVMADRIRSLAEKGQATIVALVNARAERAAGKVEIHFGVDGATAVTYAALTRAFDDLAAYSRVWDAGAMTADGEVGRAPVAFSVGFSDIIVCHDDVLLMPGAGGWSLQILLGFILLREGHDAVVIEHSDVQLEVTRARFVEEEDLPGDAEVVGQAWPTEDPGTENEEPRAPLPVVEYGELSIKTSTGQLAAFVFSNYPKVRVFVEAYEDHQRALAAVVEPDPPADDPVDRESIDEPPLDIRSRGQLWMDWAAVVLIFFLLGLPFALDRSTPATPAAPVKVPVPAAAPAASPAKSEASRSARQAPKPKRVTKKPAEPKTPGPCGLIRQPSGTLKLVPCPPASTAPPAAP